MTDAQIKAEQEAIERDYNALCQCGDAVCRAVMIYEDGRWVV